ncbi:MAG TPA: LPS export ABC transporter periplasmic protein LptC [Rhodocyclaceae bacterium]|jgi:lipopolysaccharide export system protein LptC|nr:LPS export ABC transporter periplasmic protein LptC [Rhodocyclaceae bacterium]
MKYNSTALFPIVILLMLAGLTFWLQRASQVDNTADPNARHDPDYMIDNFTVQRFDQQGSLYQTLVAQHMQHYPDDDSSDVTAPHMTYLGPRQTDVTADRANVDSGGKTIVLYDNVRVVHAGATAKDPATQIDTSKMTVFPDDEIARSDVPVTITQGKSVLHGTGLEANNKTQISVLRGRATGTIESKTK